MTFDVFRSKAPEANSRRTFAHAKAVWRDSTIVEKGFITTLSCFLLYVGLLYLLVPSDAELEAVQARERAGEIASADDTAKPSESGLVRSES